MGDLRVAGERLCQCLMRMAEFGASAPMKRPAQPEEIAPAFVFLASPQCSSYISGEILPVVGGYSGGW